MTKQYWSLALNCSEIFGWKSTGTCHTLTYWLICFFSLVGNVLKIIRILPIYLLEFSKPESFNTKNLKSFYQKRVVYACVINVGIKENVCQVGASALLSPILSRKVRYDFRVFKYDLREYFIKESATSCWLVHKLPKPTHPPPVGNSWSDLFFFRRLFSILKLREAYIPKKVWNTVIGTRSEEWISLSGCFDWATGKNWAKHAGSIFWHNRTFWTLDKWGFSLSVIAFRSQLSL